MKHLKKFNEKFLNEEINKKALLGGVLAGSLAFGAGVGLGNVDRNIRIEDMNRNNTPSIVTKSSENEPRKAYNKQKEVVVSSILADDRIVRMAFYIDYDVNVDITSLRMRFVEYCSDKNIDFFRDNDLSYILETLKVFGEFDEVNSIKNWNYIRSN